MNKIEQALSLIFDRHRIVFWYDSKQELRDEYDSVSLPDVEKVELANNEFGVKYRILREAPKQKFLLYREGPPPTDLDNWLLDVQLAHGEFHADQTALWLSEIGLGLEFMDVVQPHTDFFAAAKRRQHLKRMFKGNDTPSQVRLKMLAVCADAEPRLDNILENLLAELAEKEETRINLIRRCSLDEFLWQQLKRTYNYASEANSIADFAIGLFRACYVMQLGEETGMTNDGLVFLQRWKDNVRYQEAFDALSEEYAEILSIEQDLAQRDYLQVIEMDIFELIDRKVLSDLVQDVANRTILASECVKLIRQRRQSHWYPKYEHSYGAIEVAARFIQMLDQADLTMQSLADGIERYHQTWYQLDQLYRQFIYHMRQSGQPTLLGLLSDQIENLYNNNYLLKINDNWQQFVDQCDRWGESSILLQQDFFTDRVEPFLNKNNKVYVIVSDALRYEIGDELLRLIRQEDRYEASLEPALTMLPSFTQLGMAALLPHQTLTLSDKGLVLVDGNSSSGIQNRNNILEKAVPGQGTAIKSDDLLNMSREESRALTRDNNVVYIYHNRIDAIGDKRESEERAVDAVAETLDELMKIIKKLANANASNLLITSDHGFIYQYRMLDESDFAALKPVGDDIGSQNRRYVLGQGLKETSSFKKFTSAEVGLNGELEMLIPKSINRLRVKGAGSRYVHGGATLQEVVIPVIQVNKKRESDIALVEVNILQGANTVITTGQLTVVFYQAQPVIGKVQPRTLRVGIYTHAGELISDQHELTFDVESENTHDRELRVQLVLTKQADDANGQEVLLRLDERVSDTSHYREYGSARYILRRSFTSDFDF